MAAAPSPIVPEARASHDALRAARRDRRRARSSSLYLIYRLRTPMTWIFIAGFLAIALVGPVEPARSAHMRRGFAIAIVYLVLILIPMRSARCSSRRSSSSSTT